MLLCARSAEWFGGPVSLVLELCSRLCFGSTALLLSQLPQVHGDFLLTCFAAFSLSYSAGHGPGSWRTGGLLGILLVFASRSFLVSGVQLVPASRALALLKCCPVLATANANGACIAGFLIGTLMIALDLTDPVGLVPVSVACCLDMWRRKRRRGGDVDSRERRVVPDIVSFLCLLELYLVRRPWDTLPDISGHLLMLCPGYQFVVSLLLLHRPRRSSFSRHLVLNASDVLLSLCAEQCLLNGGEPVTWTASLACSLLVVCSSYAELGGNCSRDCDDELWV